MSLCHEAEDASQVNLVVLTSIEYLLNFALQVEKFILEINNLLATLGLMQIFFGIE